jgi:predicted DNA repair protein MutK
VVSVLITVGVYGVVALIVKLDDIGLHLARRPSALAQRLGRGLVRAMPRVLDLLSVAGVVAMLWVGGGILVHGLHELGFHTVPDLVERLAHPALGVKWIGPALGWLVRAAASAALGAVLGVALAGAHALFGRLRRKTPA